jgi:hypothetical protein
MSIGIGNIEVWAKNKGHSISRTLLYNKGKDLKKF